MWDKLTYPQKSYALVMAFLLFLMLGYRFSFADSIQLAAEVKQKQAKLIWLKERQKELPALKRKMDEFQKVYEANDSIAVRDRLTAHISDFSEQNECLVTYIPANVFYKSEHLKVQTNSFTIKGKYKDLLRLLHSLETEFRYSCKVMSARFYSEFDYQSKKKYLYITIITQTFQQQH